VADIVDKVKETGIEKSALIIIGWVLDPSAPSVRSVLYS
jgi:precorrin-4 methylase